MPINPILTTRPRGVCGVIGHRHPVDTLCSVFVAAFDATDHERRFADYLLREHESINVALDSLGFVGGRVALSGGEFCGIKDHGTFPDDAA